MTMIIPPFIYEPDKSIQVYKRTIEYLEKHADVKEKIQELSWVYQSLHHVIPTTTSSFWSGHNFPFTESWDELQISFNLICFGLYKQAMSSLRSALELGLLSVYYNINNDGHIAVKKWLSSADTKEADTPKIQDVWKILIKHENIEKFQKEFDINKRLLDLNFLHNYVHTKGYIYSNKLGKKKSNFQTFEEDFVFLWLSKFEEIIIIVMTLHLLKYPTALIKYDYSIKFGIDIPSFSHLQIDEIDSLKKYLPKDYYELLEKISINDPETRDFFEWIKTYPDMSEEDVENQIVEMDKDDIERQGIIDYKKQQLIIYGVDDFDGFPNKVKNRITKLEKWAIKKGFIESKWKKDN